jgi:hypothetical protein
MINEHSIAATKSSATRAMIEYWKLPKDVFTDSMRTINTTEPIREKSQWTDSQSALLLQKGDKR